tara:strand:+ start:157327 stop:157644 length:318 start_codon:yes stop_codon:yes gene_type:complete
MLAPINILLPTTKQVQLKKFIDKQPFSNARFFMGWLKEFKRTNLGLNLVYKNFIIENLSKALRFRSASIRPVLYSFSIVPIYYNRCIGLLLKPPKQFISKLTINQ